MSFSRTLCVPVWMVCACIFLHVFTARAQTTVSGNLMKWHKVTLTFNVVNTCENSNPNPFTDYRLDVTFTKGSKTIVVPGYYAVNGDAGNTGVTCGNKWRVHFAPPETGTWNYTVSFRTGTNVAIADNANAGTPVSPLNGTTGSINILPTDKTGNDFRAKGMLHYAGEHYKKFEETGEYFLKAGANSPENFLAYYEFDQTSDLGGLTAPGLTNGLHQYDPHVIDWNTGDPIWMSGKGKGIIGALNYLAEQGINSFYFLTYNIDGGDGMDVWMWTSPTERYRFDCSKLDQWEIVFSHMDSLGIQLHVVTQERENDQVLGGNSQLNNVRKLYYRELVARFSHHLALQWNIGEESDNTDAERAAFAQHIRDLDPYKHPITVHSQSYNTGSFYDGILGNATWLQYFEGTSIQGDAANYNSWAIQYRNDSKAAGKKWTVDQDEQVPAVKNDGSNFDELRKDALWGNLMGGGSGIEWYFGFDGHFGDVQTEDFRAPEQLYRQSRNAVEFFQTHLPFLEMEPKNSLVSGTGNYCFAKEGDIYAVYLKKANSPAALNLSRAGEYTVRWYHPKTGGALQTGSVASINTLDPGMHPIGLPPSALQDDWVALVEATSVTVVICQGDSILLGGAYRHTTGVYDDDGVTTYLTVQDCSTQCLLEVQGLTLMFEGTLGEIGALTNGMVINKDTLCRFNIRADACTDEVKSVKFKMNGVHFRTESSAPFALAGDNPAGNYNIWVPAVGAHTLEVTPYSATGGGGTAGLSYTVAFNIVDGPKSNTACNHPPVLDCNGNINGIASIDTCGMCSGGLTGIEPNTCPANCDDGDPCTDDEFVNGQCAFTPIACADNNPCTGDECVNGACVFTPQICNDNNPCTSDNCANGQCVFTPMVCNDNSSCTNDQCVNGTCVFTPQICNDNNSCTSDNCVNGQCVFTPTTTCNDNNLCTTDNCSNGQCVFVPIICNDNNSCTSDNCVNGQCMFTPTATCNDNNPCTTDNCANGQCVFVPIVCNDNNSCTSDNCVNGQCVFTPTATCNDNNPCTTDNCANGQCVFVPIICNDNNACTSDNCLNGICQFTAIVCNDNNPCTTDNCANGQCSFTNKNCNDGNACTTDGCNNGICFNNPVVCNDNNSCTTDNCVNGQCIYTLVSCNDNNSCTFDICSNGVCTFPTNPDCNACANINCNDGNACTIDTCVGGNCLRVPKSCNDANTCTFDMCANGNCYHFPVSGCGNQCPGLDCNDNNLCTTDYCGSNGRCVNLNMNCADDNPCTSDQCVSGACVHQNTCTDPCATLNCNDNNACTTDNCVGGQCSNIPIACNDGNACTSDNCVNGQCVSTPLSCTDNNACTTDNCVNGQCSHTPLVCNDNDACTADNCSNGQCIFTSLSCNDNNACTTDKCVNGQCSNAQIVCNDNDTCTSDNCVNGQCVFQNTCGNPCDNLNCNDNNACTTDNCSNGQCTHTPFVCNDNNSCTADNCANGQCVFTPLTCSDNNACTTDNCANGECTHIVLNCNDGNACTMDNCVNGICMHQNTCADSCDGVICSDEDACTTDTCVDGICSYLSPLCNDGESCTVDISLLNGSCQHTAIEVEPAYIKAINTGKSWRKLKIGYDPENFWTPKQDVIAGGNNTLCITLRAMTPVNWSAIQFRTSANNLVVLGDYITEGMCEGTWTKVCIPLSDFPAPNFDAFSFIEFPFSFGAEAFEIHVLKIEFTGGSTPFLWFGDDKTDNIHDGQSGSTSALLGEVVFGDVCNASAKKPADEKDVVERTDISVFPVPFKNLLHVRVNTAFSGTAQLRLINVIGQIMHEQSVEYIEGANQFEIQTSAELPAGVYFLRLDSDEMSETVKLVKAE